MRGDSDLVLCRVTASRPGAVALDRSPFLVAGGGQVSDVGRLVDDAGTAVAITHVAAGDDGTVWHSLAGIATGGAEASPAVGTVVRATVDLDHRDTVARAHTAAHLLNALVFRTFEGALVNGAQIYGDGTARIDFDLAPTVTNDQLRDLGAAANELVAADLPVREVLLPEAEVHSAEGVVRSLGRLPSAGGDGLVRVVEVEGFDRQACRGSHVERTGLVGVITIRKVESKGRRNRRMTFSLAPGPAV